MLNTPAQAVRHNLLEMADECLEWHEKRVGSAEHRRRLLDIVFWLSYNVGHWDD